MNHPIVINVLNNSVGIAPSSNGIMGIVFKAVAVSNNFALNTPYLLTQLSDLTALGIDAAYDATNKTAVYQQVSEFYAQAGAGALLWIYGISKATAFATFVASNAFNAFVAFTAQADPANRVKMIGFCYDVPSALQSSADFPADVTATITALQTAQQNLFQQGFQFSCIVDGYNMSSSVTPSTIGTQATNSAFAVSLCITGTQPNGVSAVGLALGRFARITIGHGFGAVEDGAVNTPTAFLTNSVVIPASGTLIVGHVYTVFGGAITYNSVVYNPGQSFTAVTGFTSYTTSANGYVADNCSPVQNLTSYANGTGDIGQLGSKQFMFLRTWSNHSGFYWNDGATCTSSTLQLSTQEFNRVANALSADALAFFIDEMGKNLPIDTKTGAVAQSYLNAKQQQFYNEFIEPLNVASGSGDLSDASLILSAPNFNSTKTMNFTLKIVPTPILGTVNGTIEFTSTL